MCVTIGTIYWYESVSKALLFISLFSVKNVVWTRKKDIRIILKKTGTFCHMSCDHIVIVGLSENVSNPNLHDVCVNSPAQLRGWTEARQKGWHMACQCKWLLNMFPLLTTAWARPTTLFVNFKENPQRKLSFKILSFAKREEREWKHQFTCSTSRFVKYGQVTLSFSAGELQALLDQATKC